MIKNRFQSAALAFNASNIVLFCIAVFHTALAVATLLLVSTLSAGAQTAAAASCGGNNLLEQLANDDPAAYQQVLDVAEQTLFGDSLLYKLEKEGVEPSYLFGTMHLTDPRVISIPKQAQEAIDSSDVVAIESVEILDPAKAQLALMAKPELTMFVGDDRLSNYLSEDDKKILSEGLAERGMQLALIDRMKPWLLNGMLALPQCELSRKQAGEPFLDIALAQNAEKAGKELVGLETIVEQIDAMASLPMDLHVQGLIDTVSLGDLTEDVIETMIVLYTEGKTATVWPLLRVVGEKYGREDAQDPSGYAEFEEVMVNTRNVTMLNRSLPLLEKGKAFIAVGALHLPGKKGLARLYEKAGYTVTAVK